MLVWEKPIDNRMNTIHQLCVDGVHLDEKGRTNFEGSVSIPSISLLQKTEIGASCEDQQPMVSCLLIRIIVQESLMNLWGFFVGRPFSGNH